MKTKIPTRLGFTGLAFLVATAMGCPNLIPIPPTPTPTPRPDYFVDITFEVIGTNVSGADVSYGDKKYVDCNNPSQLRWICTGVSPPLGQCATEDTPCTDNLTGPSWSHTYATCKGTGVKLGAVALGNPEGNLILKIKKDGNVVAQTQYDSNGFIWGGTLEYYIPSQ